MLYTSEVFGFSQYTANVSGFNQNFLKQYVS